MSLIRRTYARPRSFDVECPKCARLHVVAMPHQSTATWDHKRSELRCHCGKVWIVGLALWDPGPSPTPAGGRPLDQIPSRWTLQQLRGLVAGPVERERPKVAGKVRQHTKGRAVRTLATVECSCEYHAPPLQGIVKRETRERCAVHGGG